MLLDRILWILTTLIIPGILSALDYTEILKSLQQGGLISERLRREIDNSSPITGLSSGGCPFSINSQSHTVSRRSLENSQAAEHVLSVISELSKQHGSEEASRRVKRQLRFINCANGWAFCDRTRKYRSIDGRCNNLDNPHWGSADTHHLRYTRPEYDDGLGEPRLYSINGSCLPSARDVSKTVHMTPTTHHMTMSDKHSHMLMLWGQFLDHDITLTPQRETNNSCCTYEGVWRDGSSTGHCFEKVNSGYTSPLALKLARMYSQTQGHRKTNRESTNMCMALEVNDDTFGLGHTCMEFQRSLAVPYGDCALGHREQLNRLTAFIDGSQIYGSDENLALELRSLVNGTLKAGVGHLLPHEDRQDTFLYSECLNHDECFKAGDSRVNIQPGLAAIHTLFMNEHNRIAGLLRTQLPDSESSKSTTEIDEFIYQETRKVIGAMLQHITYNEFLPILLGPRNMRRYSLIINKNITSSRRYFASHQPGIRNEFATFAFRVGHTLVPEGLMPLSSDYSRHGKTMSKFDDLFMNPHMVYKHGIGDLLRGIVSEPAKMPGAHVSHHMEKLFKFSNRTRGGMDLIAVNIQRGRDHGIPGYTKLLKHCRLPVPNNFSDLNMPEETKQKLELVYQSVHDIDAWTGAVSEHSLRGAMVGPLNGCIIGRQFRSLRRGDRFWYESQQPHVGFTDGQLEEIYKVTLARVLCDNLNNMRYIQPNVFYMVSWNQLLNKHTLCSDIPELSLDDWFTT